MKVALFFFSGTGNTWKITEYIKSYLIELGHETNYYSIERKDLDWNDLLPKILSESDIIGVGYPVYGSDIPIIMKDWIKEILCTHSKDRAENPRAFIYDTMAMFSGDTPLIMRRRLKKCGFKVKQAINIRALCNIPQMPRLMVWEEEKQKEIFNKAELKCRKLIDKVIQNKKWVMRRDPITRLVAIIQRISLRMEIDLARKMFEFDMDKCTLCGICVDNCPVGNLSIEETEDKPRISYGPDCIVCMRCFNSCPQDTIIVMKRSRDTEKYRRFRGQVPGFNFSKVKNN